MYLIFFFFEFLIKMYPTDQSISSYSSNPSTPVNSPPPLTSQAPHQQPHPLHSATSSSGPTTWQQLTPVINGGSNSGLSGMPNGSYTPELVQRGLHMVSTKLYCLQISSTLSK